VRCFITGISSFLGAQLAQRLVAGGWAVGGSVRRQGSPIPTGAFPVATIRLGEPFDKELFSGVNLVVHCAHDFGTDGFERNTMGTQTLHAAAKLSDVRRQIYVSSYSARPDALSRYGRTKYELEQFFLRQGATIVRPGLVIGTGGMFGRMMRALLKSPVIPLVDGGLDLVPVIGIRDFVQAMMVILHNSGRNVYNLFNREQVSVRSLSERICRLAGRKPLFVGMSYRNAMLLLDLAQKLHLPVPVAQDSLRSLKQNQQSIHESDLSTLLDRETLLDESLQFALETRY